MKNINVITFSIFTLYGGYALSDEVGFIESIMPKNVISTDVTALVKTISVELYKDHRSKESIAVDSMGYITYKFTADVERLIKGKVEGRFDYYLTYDSDIKPKISEYSQIVNLCLSLDKRLYIPGNGYRFNATDRLVELAIQAAKVYLDEQSNDCKWINSQVF